MSAGRVTVELAREDHADAVAAFYRSVWDGSATGDSVLAGWQLAATENLATPGQIPPTAIVLQDGRVIGYCGSLAQRLWDGRTEYPSYWVKGLMVLPEFRNGPIGFLVLKELARHLPCSTSLSTAPAAHRLLASLGYQYVGVIPNLIRVLRPGRIASRIDLASLGVGRVPSWLGSAVRLAQRTRVAGVVAGAAGLAVSTGLRMIRGSGARYARAYQAPDRGELDQLWLRCRKGMGAGPVRDGGYLTGRFAGEPYSFVSVRDGQGLAGVAIVKRPRGTGDERLRGIRVAALADMVYDPTLPEAGAAVLAAAEESARKLDADALLATNGHPVHVRLLRSQAYLPFGGNAHLLIRDTVRGNIHWPGTISAWWLARGDGQSDEPF